MAKIEIIVKTPLTSSGPRGIDVYARLLAEELSRISPLGDIAISHDHPTTTHTDLIHYTFFDLFYHTLTKFNSKTPFLVTIHDVIPLLFPTHFPVGIRGRIKFFLQKLALKKAKGIITDSYASQQDICRYLNIPKERVFVIPLAPGHRQVTAKLTQTVKREYQLPDKYILYVGDINWNKNVVGLIRSFAELKAQNIHLLLVGKAFVSSPRVPEFVQIEEAISESGKQELIHRLGFVPGHHLGAIYRLATLYVQPSWYEGFGFPVLEALSQGTPVLSSNQGSLPEVGGDNVHYFNPQVKDELRSTLEKLLSSPSLLGQYHESGLAWAKTFSWSKVAKNTLAVYEKILK